MDIQELERQLAQLTKRVEAIAERATRREEEFAEVKTLAKQAAGLADEVRELKRASGRSPRAEEAPAPSPSPVTTRLDDAALGRIVELVLARLREKKGLPTMEELTAEVTKQLRVIDLTALAKKLLDDVTVGGVEERLARLLRERMQSEVDSKTVRGLIVEALLKQFSLDAFRGELIQALAAKVAEALEVSTKRRY